MQPIAQRPKRYASSTDLKARRRPWSFGLSTFTSFAGLEADFAISSRMAARTSDATLLAASSGFSSDMASSSTCAAGLMVTS